jgi:DNA-binding NarL/FixJ family response regulator
MRLLLIDDHVLFRHGLKYLLSDLDPAIEFVEADGVDQLNVSDASNENIDLALLDLHLNGASGSNALIALRRLLPDTMVVVITGEEDPQLIRRCIDLGAAGFIPKSSTSQVMISALRLALAGGTYLPPHVLETSFRAAPPAPFRGPNSAGSRSRESTPHGGGLAERLSSRQLEVLLLAVRGRSNKMIARELSLSEGTVKQHLSAAFRTLGVANRTEAVFAAADIGLRAPK